MKNIIFKVIFKRGTKGSKGDTGVNFVVPTGAIVGYDGTDTPEGYEDTPAPEGFSMGADISPFRNYQKMITNSTISVTEG